jgi:hypothetical protein
VLVAFAIAEALAKVTAAADCATGNVLEMMV